MRKMDFEYLEFLTDYGIVHRPYIEVSLKYRRRSVFVLSMVDSGADFSTFATGIGELLGLNVKSGEMREVVGIGKKPIPVFLHTIRLCVDKHEFKFIAGFGDDLPPILGQEGFFEYFDVGFSYSKKRIKLIPAKKTR